MPPNEQKNQDQLCKSSDPLLGSLRDYTTMSESSTTSDIAIAMLEKNNITEAISALSNMSRDIAPMEVIWIKAPM